MIFLSHSAAEVVLAEFIEEQLRSAPEIEVFRTSRVDQIPSGRDWFNFVTSNLKIADAFLVLVTPFSQTRPWILFETGAAWRTEKPLVLGLAGGLAKDSVLEPVKHLQLLSLEEPTQASHAFRVLGSRLQDPDGFCERVKTLAEGGRREALLREGWKQITFNGERYAWDGPFHDIPDATPRAVPDGLTAALNAAGLQCQFGIPDKLLREFEQGFSILYHIDQHKRKRQLLASYGQCLLVRESAA